MTLKFDYIADADKTLDIIKNRDQYIRDIYKLYLKKYYPKYNKRGIMEMIREKCGISKSALYMLLDEKDEENQKSEKSIYQKRGAIII